MTGTTSTPGAAPESPNRDKRDDLDTAPLILTLRFDADSFARLDALRRAHFPPERNHLRAHLTLFHHLPGNRLEEVTAATAAAAAHPPFPLDFPGLTPLGRGVAAQVVAPPLKGVRARVGDALRPHLTPQDSGGLRPHVTLQNKVDPADARALLAELAAGWTPWTGRAEGLLLHRYRGGPWELVAEFPFRG